MSFLKGMHRGMTEFGQTIAGIVNTVLLIIVYVAGIGATSLVAKLARKRFLDTAWGAESYWRDLDLKKKETRDYYRQF